MKRYEYMTIRQAYPLEDWILNGHGQQGWHLTAIYNMLPTGMYGYVFARLLAEPLPILHEPLEHEARASRKDPMVSSDPSTDQEAHSGTDADNPE